MPPVEMTPSAYDHGEEFEDVMWAIEHAEGKAQISGHPGETTWAFVGRRHAQTDDYIEVLAVLEPPRSIRVFHAMPLTDMYRNLLEG